MIERRNLKLVLTLTLWFLIVSVLPATLVFVALRHWSEAGIVLSAENHLGYVARSKARLLERVIDEQGLALTTVALQLNEEVVIRGDVGVNIEAFLAQHAPLNTSYSFYFIGPDTRIISPWGTTLPWVPTESSEYSEYEVHLTKEHLYMAHKISTMDAWLVLTLPMGEIEWVLREDINDRVFYSARTPADAALAVGTTADIALFAPDGSTLVRPLVYSEGGIEKKYRSQLLPSDSTAFHVVTTNKMVLLAHNYSLEIGGSPYTLVVLQAKREVAQPVSETSRRELLLWISGMVALLVLLYVFVTTVGRTIVRPIYLSVRDLLQLGERLSTNMQGTEGVMKDQLSVSKKLVASHTSQLSDMKKVNDELNAIVREFKTIMAATSVTARSAADINVAARESGAQAQKARDGIVDIKRLASSHEAMVTTLSHYSAEVAGIARDIESLSQAISYLSLNATIEGSGRSHSGKSLTRLVSEAGKLARVSHESSARIHELLVRIQQSLQETTHSAKLEVVSSQASTAVINDALERLSTMSRDTEAIASSVTKINALISVQRERIDTIFGRSESVTVQARDTMRSAVMVSDVAEKQRASIRATSAMLKKLRATIETLHNLIDRKRT